MSSKHIAWAIALMAAGTSIAGINQWTSIGPDGASIYGGVRHLQRAGAALACTTQGIYRTTDSGLSWTRVLQFSTYGVYQGVATNWNSAAPDIVLAHGDGSASILRSTNAGESWSRVDVGLNSHVSAATFSRDGAFAWAATAGGLAYRSGDGGASWTERSNGLAPGMPIYQLDVDATAAATVYAVIGNQVWRTTDGGGNWAAITAPSDSFYRVAASRQSHGVLFAIKSNAPSGIYRSTDGGTTFSLALAGQFQAVEFLPTTAGRALAVRDDRQLMYTEDNGQTWVGRSRLGLGVAMNLTFDPTQERHVMVGTNSGLLFSDDSGVSWSARMAGMRELTVGALATNPASNRVYALTFDEGKVYQRDPQQGFWGDIGRDVDSTVNLIPGTQGYALAVSPSQFGSLYIVNNGRLGRSIAGGPWTALGTVGEARSITFDSVDPQLMYVGSLSDSRKSVDGGVTWTTIGGGLPPGIQDIVVDRADPNVLYAAKSLFNNPAASSIYKSIDQGATWTGVGNLPAPWAWRLVGHPVRGGTLYAGTQTGLWRSTDGAVTWSQIFGANGGRSVFDVVIDPVRPEILYVSSNGNAADSARSVDGGATWEPLRMGNIGASNPLPLYLALVPGEPATLVNARSGYGLFEMVVAPDVRITGGSTELLADLPASLTLTLENHGPFSATDLEMVASIPPSSTAITIQPGAGLACVEDQQILTCTTPVLRVNETRHVVIGLTPSQHSYEVHANLRLYERDPNPFDNLFRRTTERRSDLQAQLTSSVATAQTGTTFSYVASITTSGPSPGGSIAGYLTLPANVTFASAATAGLDCSHATGTVTCVVERLAVGQTASATITVNAAASGNANATFEVRSIGTDPVDANNSASRSVTVSVPPASSSSGGGSSSGGSSSSSSSSGGKGKGGGSLDFLLLGSLVLLARAAALGRARAH